jgi:hypothetical protein
MGPVNQTANLVLPAFPRLRQSFETPEASSGNRRCLVDRGEEMLPIADVVCISDEVGDRQFTGRPWFFLQL